MKQINRDLYLKKLIDRKENGLIKIITGIRRCGKKLFAVQFIQKLSFKSQARQINSKNQQ